MATRKIEFFDGFESESVPTTEVPTGPQGPQGPQGPKGDPDSPGGTAGQVLTKDSATDYDASWQDIPEDTSKIDKSTGTTYNVNAFQAVTQSEYDAIITPDADTIYFII